MNCIASRSLSLFSLATISLAACDPQPQPPVQQQAAPVVAQAPETVLVHDDHTGSDLLMLCAIGVICNNGPVIHTYTSYDPAPLYIRRTYYPSSPYFYRSQPAYVHRTTIVNKYYSQPTSAASTAPVKATAAAVAPPAPAPKANYSWPSAATNFAAPTPKPTTNYARPTPPAPRSAPTTSYARPSSSSRRRP